MERGAPTPSYLPGIFGSTGKRYSTMLSKIAMMAKVLPEEDYDF